MRVLSNQASIHADKSSMTEDSYDKGECCDRCWCILAAIAHRHKGQA
ncbi:MAG: hypothetical protein RBJ76_16890 [Stenomitos frigidus ULC029]